MRNLAMLISYDGTAYSGFQSQPSGNTIQDRLEAAIRLLTGEDVKIIGSGRTDAGVHARGQVIQFRTASRIPVERWPLAMNSRLPDDIVVHYAQEVPEHFHARRSALRKTYRYTILNARHPNVFARRCEFHHPRPLDVDAMKAGLSYLVGEHDFTSFCSAQTEDTNRVRTIYDASIKTCEIDGDAGMARGRRITVDLTGNGFLYNMVRIIVGTILLVGEGKMAPEHIRDILEARDRRLAGPTAMAHGLMLWEVVYEDFQPFLHG